MRRKQAKFIEHGGTARVIAIAIARVLLPVLCFLGAFGRAMFVPIQVWAHQQAFATTTLRGMGMEILTGFATAPSTTFTALTMATGDSLQVRNSNPAKNVWLLGMWAQNQVAGSFRVHSPKLHDNVQGIRIRNNTGDTLPLFPRGIKQLLYPQDVLVAEITGSAVGGKIEQGSLLMYYEDLPGSTARLITLRTCKRAASTYSRCSARLRRARRAATPALRLSMPRWTCSRPTLITRSSAITSRRRVPVWESRGRTFRVCA
jgi:hypothetical protein